MPRYDFRCSNCGEVFELVRTFSQSSEPATCPACKGMANRIMATDFTVFSKSYTGWATRVQGTDWPWRDKAEKATTQADATDEEEEDEEEDSEEAVSPSGHDAPGFARYKDIFEDKVKGSESKDEPTTK